MSANPSPRLSVVKRLLTSWHLPALLGLLLIIGLVIWVFPQRLDRVVSADGRHEWTAHDAPPQQQVLWESPQPVEGLLPRADERGGLITPRLGDGGATLYFAYRPRQGDADIYRSRLVGERWEPAEPVAELNTKGDDLGPTLSKDGRHLYFYSNRPGGQGGFDLYAAEWSGKGWDAPRNLGPTINSPAHEYDPALDPAGLTLVFSSNRTPQMQQRTQEAPGEGDWAATLRAHPGLTRFDLYKSRRTTPEEAWSVPEPLAELNLPETNEGAPTFSPSGAFLYFASDRPARDGETPNLDLYRARRVSGRFLDPTNLGPGVNTVAHDTEPALSPEGFTLVFSSNRDGRDALYLTTAQEVYAETTWDTSRLQALSGIWWQALLVTALLAALVAVFMYSRGWLFQTATVMRFFVASLLLHLLILLLMWVVPLAQGVADQAEEIRVSQYATQLLDDRSSSAESAQEPYEKVADLSGPAAVAIPELTRQAATPPDVPDQPDPTMPAVPVQVARQLPPERVLTVPARIPQEVRQPNELQRRSLTAPTPVAALERKPLELPPAEVRPQEKPLTTPEVTSARTEPTPAAPTPLELPRRSPDQPPRAATLDLKPVDAAQPLMREPGQAPLVRAQRLPSNPTPEAAPESLKVELPVPSPAETTPKTLAPRGAAVTVDRRDPAVVQPSSMVPADRPVNLPSALERKDGVKDLEPIPLAGEQPRASSPTDPFQRATAARRMPDTPAVPLQADAGTPPSADAAPGEKPLPGRDVSLAKSNATGPDMPVPKLGDLAGPRDPLVRRPNVAELSPRTLDVPPRVAPADSRLPRRPADAGRVAKLEEDVGELARFALRQGEMRKEAVEKFGGSDASEQAVERGLAWLASVQNADGSWSLHKHEASVTSDAAGTGLALLPFLGAGHTHQGGKYQKAVERGLKWLVEHQKKDGYVGSPDNSRPMYTHGIASIVLCEAYGMTRDPNLKGPAQKALDFIAAAQHGPTGGWRYQPNQPADTSVTGWQVMALKSGEMAGLSVRAEVLAGARKWLESVETSQAPGGLFGYQSRTATPAMTAQALLSLQLLGTRRDDPRMKAGADYLLKNLPDPKKDTSYYWYHATQVMYHMQGQLWKEWNDRQRDLLVSTQVTQGAQAGSWTPVDAREKAGGRICATSFRLLMLEVYYRHLPLYQQLKD